MNLRRRAVLVALAALVAGVGVPTAAVAETGPDPAWAAISVNEVSSNNAGTPGQPFADPVELYNAGDTAVDLTGWKQTDSGSATGAAPFAAGVLVDGTPSTVVPPHGYAVFGSTKGLGSGGDAVKLYAPDGTLIDEHRNRTPGLE